LRKRSYYGGSFRFRVLDFLFILSVFSLHVFREYLTQRESVQKIALLELI
jgi:hypothetical protein